MVENANQNDKVVCKELPELKRLNYCYGQMLGAQDFVDEQAYFRDKIALLTRCLQGYGVVCGLIVGHDVEEITISCGLAVDSCGRELILHRPFKCDLKSLLPEEDRAQLENESQTGCSLYLTIEYDEHAVDPQRPPKGGCCGEGSQPFMTRWRESPYISLTFDKPPQQNCSSCCGATVDGRIWLAKLTFKDGTFSIDNTVRRRIATYETTKVSGINWLHAGLYREFFAEWLLNHGLEIYFSAPVQVASILAHEATFNYSYREPNADHKRPGGVVTKWQSLTTNDLVEVAVGDELVVHSNSPLEVLQCTITPLNEETMQTEHGKVKTATGIRVVINSSNLGAPKRVLVTVRTEFILDVCGRPVDGCNVGAMARHVGVVPASDTVDRTAHHYDDQGDPVDETDQQYEQRVNQLATGYKAALQEHSKRFPLDVGRPYLDPTLRSESGNGSPGSNFQSWFYSVEDEGGLPKA